MSDLVCRVEDSISRFHLKLTPSIYILASVWRVRVQGISQALIECPGSLGLGSRHFHMCSSSVLLVYKEHYFVICQGMYWNYRKYLSREKCLDLLMKIAVLSQSRFMPQSLCIQNKTQQVGDSFILFYLPFVLFQNSKAQFVCPYLFPYMYIIMSYVLFFFLSLWLRNDTLTLKW